MKQECCDNCGCYKWYYDWCQKWQWQVDGRSVYDCWEEEWDGKKQKGMRVEYKVEDGIVKGRGIIRY